MAFITSLLKGTAIFGAKLGWGAGKLAVKYGPKVAYTAGQTALRGLTGAVSIPGVVAGASVLGIGYSLFGGPDASQRGAIIDKVGQVAGLPRGSFDLEKQINMLSDPANTSSMNVNYNKQALAVSSLSSGIAPMGGIGTFQQMAGPMHKAFMNSTVGLTQGLHQSRHNG